LLSARGPENDLLGTSTVAICQPLAKFSSILERGAEKAYEKVP
jgi:hypothetical protein